MSAADIRAVLSPRVVAVKNIGGIFLSAPVVGCSNASAPTPVALSPPPSPNIPLMISGIVAEGTQPIAGAQVDNGSGAGEWVFTASNGAFQLPHFNREWWVHAQKKGYVQPCTTPIRGDAPLNVQLVSRAALSGATLPSPDGFRTVSGVVDQITKKGTQPVADVAVDWEPDEDWAAAYTYSDANGRFSLCGLPVDAVTIRAVNSIGSYATSTVPPSETTVELTLQPYVAPPPGHTNVVEPLHP
jgi:hypothetical protein